MFGNISLSFIRHVLSNFEMHTRNHHCWSLNMLAGNVVIIFELSEQSVALDFTLERPSNSSVQSSLPTWHPVIGSANIRIARGLLLSARRLWFFAKNEMSMVWKLSKPWQYIYDNRDQSGISLPLLSSASEVFTNTPFIVIKCVITVIQGMTLI